MAGDFSEVLDKFAWAKHQIALLDQTITDYVNEKPYVSAVEDKPDAEAYQVVARLRKPPPRTIAHITGDVLNNLHGTLDYLAWQLALRENEVPDRAAYFPIVDSTNKDGSEKPVNVYRWEDTRRRAKVPMLKDPGVLKLLRDVQPVYRPESERSFHPLVVLSAFNGHSKHQHPSVLVSAIDQGHYEYCPSGPFREFADRGVNLVFATVNFCPLHDGQEMAWVPYAWAPDGGPPEHDHFTTFVALKQLPIHPKRPGKPYALIELVTEVADFVGSKILDPIGALF